MSDFNKGDAVFLTDGSEAEYISGDEEGHIVRSSYEDEYGEPVFGKPFVVHKVFKAAPRLKYDQETKEAAEKLRAINDELNTARIELYEAKRGREEALKLVNSHPDLAPLAEWMRGEITHVVVLPLYGGAIKIVPYDQAITPENPNDARNGEVRLLSLCGGKKYGDNLHWRLNRYYDGSDKEGSLCILATSYENALVRMQAWIDKELRRHDNYYRLEIADQAMRMGLKVSDDLEKQVAEKRRNAELRRLEQARKNLAQSEASLKKYRAELEALEASSPQPSPNAAANE
jgi:hypothetical protein